MKRVRVRRLVLAAAAVVVAAVVVVLLLPALDHMRFSYRNPGQAAREQLNQCRRRLMTPQRVVEAMRLEPDMTILDLGAGYGLFTFPFAQAVGHQGRVFATDCDPDAVDFLAKRVGQMGLTNVVPVRVQQRGLDTFYKAQTFDVIFACDVLPYLGKPEEQKAFLSELRSSLRPNGRLWVLLHRFDCDFNEAEFEDWNATTAALECQGAQVLLVQRLRPEVSAALTVAAEPAAESWRTLLVEDLNRMLEDPTLWPEIEGQFQPLKVYLNPLYQRPREYLVRKLERAGGFTGSFHNLPDGLRPLLRLLNRLIIQDLLETNVWAKAFTIDQFQVKNWKFIIERLPPEIVPLVEQSGYQLVREHTILTTHLIWEFRNVAPAEVTK